ncbi:glycoside hydrolase TIM-barrel-like domain-containing protein [Fluviibacterium sp. DFM31]|uniref:Glycoside hydrolase TIM-barrel-like domain-containing protein n=1 Tax=Meridianimarinicoccus marinus TaxID=3231483 RepID=A0ABV3L2Z7_9RHOB
MATLLLSAAGAAAGSALGGSFLGLSAAVIGRAAGATIGRAIDQRIMGSGSQVVERGQVDRFRVTGASQGAPIPQVFGRIRVPGQVIWASNFEESRKTTRVGGGKGGAPKSKVRTYSYSVSVAVALCEGEISRVGRIWADGQEIRTDQLSLRVYRGSETQLPDPKIAAVEGSENAPAFRGTAYVVFEDLQLEAYGNRVPQFSFEVIRPEQPAYQDADGAMVDGVQAVALIPGTGEYALSPERVHYVEGFGLKRSANVNSPGGRTDFTVSMDALQEELPNCGAVSLVVSWFGDDLRCDRARIRPKVEQKLADGDPDSWHVAGLERYQAQEVPKDGGRSIYGGTPSDASVIGAIRNLNARGQKVMFYPFILMDQLAGNGLSDPWTGAADQPPLPWRGRITTSIAPGQPGSPDKTAAAATEVGAFFGSARASDFSISGDTVTYTGPNEWSLRRFILHNAALCKAAGGVESFCIGSEMRSLTQIRDSQSGCPAVAEFKALAGEVRALLGGAVKLGYAADWSEYFGYSPTDGSGDHLFHLDPLWADPEIDFIGIDNYMPLSDWRDEAGHADESWGSIYDLDYLKANVAGGEGYDWYYASAADAAAQLRSPITDGAYGEPWVFRYKDLRGWWSSPHHNRIGGVRAAGATPWVPRSKPIWFTELGCAAIDKGTNQPNKFLDPKSSESVLPRASTGARDDLIQMQYLRAMVGFWSDPAQNPVSGVYGGPMVDMSRAFVWAWDARPYPWFPGRSDVWSDGDNYLRGHWLNGRTGAQLLSTVVREICVRAGVADPDVSGLHGLVRGYAVGQPESARAALEPLMLAHGFDALEREGRLVFRSRGGAADAVLGMEDLAQHPEEDGDLSVLRAADSEVPGRVRLDYVAADSGFDVASIDAAVPGGEVENVARSELNMVLTRAEARGLAERWLAEGRIARDTVKLALPPSRMDLGAGDVIDLPHGGSLGRFRVDRCEDVGLHLLEAVRVETPVYQPGPAIEEVSRIAAFPAPVPPSSVFLDLPLLRSEDVPHAPYLAVAARPWPGEIAVYGSGSDSDYDLNTLVELGARVGLTRTDLTRAAPGRLDRGAPLTVEIPEGGLSSVSEAEMLNGANALAIGDGSPGNWEVVQFRHADLVGPDLFDLSERLRGQLGSDGMIPDVWPAGSLVVVLDAALVQIELASAARGLTRHYRIGPSDQPYTDPSFVHQQAAFSGNGLRPYAPVHLHAEVTATGDHRLRWIRRSRVDGDLWSLPEIPLGEAQERYLLRIRQGTIRREVTVTSPQWTYDAASRAADGVSGPYTLEVAQLSDRFGPGLFGKVTING